MYGVDGPILLLPRRPFCHGGVDWADCVERFHLPLFPAPTTTLADLAAAVARWKTAALDAETATALFNGPRTEGVVTEAQITAAKDAILILRSTQHTTHRLLRGVSMGDEKI